MTVKWVRQDEVNDYFEIKDGEGNVEYISFPKTMEMSEEDVYDFIK